jgi:hypothetical protein
MVSTPRLGTLECEVLSSIPGWSMFSSISQLGVTIPSQTDNTVKTRLPQPQRSSFAIPYQTLTALDPSAAIAANSNDLPSYHFNSRGEIINFTHSGVRAEVPHIARNIEVSRFQSSVPYSLC